MRPIAAVVIFLMITLFISDAQAEIYSWTDENGVKHYSHTPPPERSTPVKTAPEIKTDPTADEIQEIINETNVETILEQLDEENPLSSPKAAITKKPPSHRERIQAAAEKLQEKIAWLEQLPPRAYTNTRSKQAIIGRYQYRLQQLLSNPDAYFEKYGY